MPAVKQQSLDWNPTPMVTKAMFSVILLHCMPVLQDSFPQADLEYLWDAGVSQPCRATDGWSPFPHQPQPNLSLTVKWF